jgi:hypothetical protein
LFCSVIELSVSREPANLIKKIDSNAHYLLKYS